MGDRLEKLFFKICEYLCYELGYTVYANDTHRWVDSDGWYEVQFTLLNGEKEIYINTQYGDRDLEEEWTNNNGPCEISDAFYSMKYSSNYWDFTYFFSNFIDDGEFNTLLPNDLKMEIKDIIDEIENL